MATMYVILPDPMKDWVEAKAATGRYNDASDYVRELIRRDQQREDDLSALRQVIDEAEASGVSDRTVEDIIDDAQASQLKTRHAV